LGHSHSIYVFDAEAPEEDYWKPMIYQKISRRISERFAVIYITEQNETSTVRHFSKIGLPVEDYIESGALTIISKDTFYSPSETSNTLTEQWVKLFSTIEKKRGRENFKGFVAIGMPSDSFFTSEMFQQRLVEYEFVVADNDFNRRMEAMCCYTSRSIDKMPLKYIIMLLNSHQNTAHKDGKLKKWDNVRGIEIIKKGLCEALGPQVSNMVFKILMLDFGNDTGAMILYPDKLENKLRILFGPSTGEVILNKIKAEFKKEIIY
jgi:DcmR-like sensory protein